MMVTLVLILSVALCLISTASGFQARPAGVSRVRGNLAMEYIPDGLTKEQWKALKKKEADELKAKGNLGAMGTTRFKSRSFEAWQKSGGKHLFPVDPRTTPYEERPYMQRRNGDWEGKDLESKGYKGAGQGAKGKRLAIDSVYEVAKKEGRLDSPSILGGIPLPWTSKDANKISNNKPREDGSVKKGQQATAGRQLSAKQLAAKKAKLAKVSNTKAAAPAAVEEAPKKKGLFGLF